MSNRARSVFLSAISGNILEYYDFTVYIVFISEIGRAFFPSSSVLLETLLSLVGFAVGFVLRPIGGIVFGYIGDKYGRRISLIISMLGMTIPTFIIGIIPTYYQIGYAAPTILIIMRLIQGLCISGEGAGAAIFILEHYQNLRPGLTTGLVHASNIAGTLIASFIGILIEKYIGTANYGWRFAFLLGGAMGLVGFYLRLSVSETPIFRILSKKRGTLKAPFIHVIQTAWRAMLITMCAAAAASSTLYLVKTYVNVFLKNTIGCDGMTTLLYYAYTSIVAMVAMPISGLCSDLIGRTKMMIVASSIIFVLAIPTLMLMNSDIALERFLGLTLLGILGGAISGTSYIFVISLFEPEQRFSGVGFSYNLGIAIFGGTSAIFSQWLVSITAIPYAGAFYIMFTSFSFLLVILSTRNFLSLKENK